VSVSVGTFVSTFCPLREVNTCFQQHHEPAPESRAIGPLPDGVRTNELMPLCAVMVTRCFVAARSAAATEATASRPATETTTTQSLLRIRKPPLDNTSARRCATSLRPG
jgi:hypothetical protein